MASSRSRKSRSSNLRITPDQIREDIKRYSQLHSWYKHLSPQGEEFYLFFRRGQQPRNDIVPEVTDRRNLHCWAVPKSLYDSGNVKYHVSRLCRENPVIFTSEFDGGRTSAIQIERATQTSIYLAARLGVLDLVSTQP